MSPRVYLLRKWQWNRVIYKTSQKSKFQLAQTTKNIYGTEDGCAYSKIRYFSHISDNDETWHIYILPKEDPKNLFIIWPSPWVLLISTFFSPEINSFHYSGRDTQKMHFLYKNYNSFDFLWLLKDFLNKHDCNFGDVSQIKVFWNKDYNLIISVHDVNNKNL